MFYKGGFLKTLLKNILIKLYIFFKKSLLRFIRNIINYLIT